MSKRLLTAAMLLCALLLCGCTSVTKFEHGRVTQRAQSLTLVLEEGETALLDTLPRLTEADFSGSRCYEEIVAWAEEHPEVSVRYTVLMPDGSEVSSTQEELDLSALPGSMAEEAAEKLKYLPALRFVELGGDDGRGLSPESLAPFVAAKGDREYGYSFTLCGRQCSIQDSSISLIGAERSDIRKLKLLLPVMTGLEQVSLGSQDTNPELSFDDIADLQQAAPNAEFDYAFTLFGRSFTLQDREINLSHVRMNDEGAAVLAAARCMPNLEKLDMDSCGVSNEAMERIRDALPGTDVVWRIWFGINYSVRTDVKKILASNPGRGGTLDNRQTAVLKYCTKLKYLDLGHNESITDLSFVCSMPDLEVLNIAMNPATDLTPVASCTHLEYLDIHTTEVSDLSPISGLTELRHLNIGNCPVSDISPLYGLTELERLWIGCIDPVPAEQVEKMRECAPNCEIDVRTYDPEGGRWRYTGALNRDGTPQLTERYALLREQMGFDSLDYSFSWRDPLY